MSSQVIEQLHVRTIVVENGANLDAKNNKKETALDIAKARVSSVEPRIVNYLTFASFVQQFATDKITAKELFNKTFFPQKMFDVVFSITLAQGKDESLEKLHNYLGAETFVTTMKRTIKNRDCKSEVSLDATPADGDRWNLQLLRIALHTKSFELFKEILSKKGQIWSIAAGILLPAVEAPKLVKPEDQKLVAEIKLTRKTWKDLPKDKFRKDALQFMLIKGGLGHGKITNNEKILLPTEVGSRVMKYLSNTDFNGQVKSNKK